MTERKTDSELEAYILVAVAGRPGLSVRRLIMAVWRLWRRGALRVDWQLRLWPVTPGK
jgi:hypothetical protein